MDWNEIVLQNLEDAGCSREMISQYEDIARQNISERAVRSRQTQLLRGYRKGLLARLHEDQRKIDCLDHLLYQMKSEA